MSIARRAINNRKSIFWEHQFTLSPFLTKATYIIVPCNKFCILKNISREYIDTLFMLSLTTLFDIHVFYNSTADRRLNSFLGKTRVRKFIYVENRLLTLS